MEAVGTIGCRQLFVLCDIVRGRISAVSFIIRRIIRADKRRSAGKRRKNAEKHRINGEKCTVSYGRVYAILVPKEACVMKKITIILSVFAALSLSGTAASAEEGCKHSIIDGEAVIIGFSGEPEHLQIPDFIEGCPVTEIRDNAFYNCGSLISVELPDTLMKIGHHSFYACNSLESVALPEGLEQLGAGCFCGCTAMKYAEIPESLVELPDSCFRACSSLSEITLPDKLESIGQLCFAGCIELKSAELPESLGVIGEKAFYMCDRLRRIYLPPSVGLIGDKALGYTCDGNSISRTADMLIISRKDTAAENYAEDNGFCFAEGGMSDGRTEEHRPWLSSSDIPYTAALAVFGTLTFIAVRLAMKELCRKKRQ